MKHPSASKWTYGLKGRAGTSAGRLWLLTLLSLSAVLLLAACASHTPAPPASPSSVLNTVSGLQAASVVDVRQVRRALTAEEAKDYLGNGVCASCHKDVALAHERSTHAHTLRPVMLQKDGPFFRSTQSITDPALGCTYSTFVSEGKCVFQGRNARGASGLPVAYVMGSGHNAYTYLSLSDPRGWIELRLSYYEKAKKWDYTPAQLPGVKLERAAGRIQSGAMLTSCLLCHVTTLRQLPAPLGPDGLPTDEGPPDMKNSLLGVGCERCHGPGRAHVDQALKAHASTPELLARAKAAGQTYGMEDLHKATPDVINTLCGACHRTVANAESSDPHTEMNLSRFQGVALSRSPCYQKSGTLSCLTCHDSHRNANSNPAYYDAICLTCHSGDRQGDKEREGTGGTQSTIENRQSKIPSSLIPHPSSLRVCPVNPRAGCTGCHMPKQTIADIPHVRYSTHWIKVWQDAPTFRNQAHPH